MIVPANYEEMSDQELLEALQKTYEGDAAQYVFDILRGNISEDVPIE